MTNRLPTLFLSHGSPMLTLQDTPARDFLSGLAREYGRPEAIVVASGHWEAFGPTVGVTPTQSTIHDFYGFPDELYRLTYPAPGEPTLAREIVGLLEAAGMPARADERRGLDHGAWTVLRLGWPEADIPVVGVSLLPVGGPAAHIALGRALAPLRDRDILIVGSGSFTHALREIRRGPTEEGVVPWVREFRGWMHEAITTGDEARMIDYRRQCPHAARSHPTEDHFMPLFFAMGAAGPGATGRVIHDSTISANQGMDCFAFG